MEGENRTFPQLETRRMKLRKPLDKDRRGLYLLSRNEQVMRYYGMEPFKSEQDADAEIRGFNQLYNESRGIRWIITEKDGDNYVGDIGYHNHVGKHERAEVGFKLAPERWRKGIMTEVLHKVLEYGFESIGLNRIEALVDPRNVPSMKLLEKTGFIAEGILREYEYERGGFVDLAMLSLLAHEWRVRTGPWNRTNSGDRTSQDSRPGGCRRGMRGHENT